MREWKGSGTNKIFYIENLLFLFNNLALCGANGRFESFTFLEQLILITTKSLSLLWMESSLFASFLQSLTLYSLSHNHNNQSFCGFYDQSFIKRSFLWGGGWGSYISSRLDSSNAAERDNEVSDIAIVIFYRSLLPSSTTCCRSFQSCLGVENWDICSFRDFNEKCDLPPQSTLNRTLTSMSCLVVPQLHMINAFFLSPHLLMMTCDAHWPWIWSEKPYETFHFSYALIMTNPTSAYTRNIPASEAGLGQQRMVTC